MVRARTGRSALTDDQLMLLDAMALHPVSGGLLWSDVYELHLNVPLGHVIADDELASALECLKEAGLVEIEAREGEEEDPGYWTLSLTRAGGEVWSSERLPPWDEFLEVIDENSSEGFRVHFVSPSRRIAAEACAAYEKCGIIDGRVSGRGEERVESFPLVYWHDPMEVWRVGGVYRHRSRDPGRGECVDRLRTWWSLLSELLRIPR